MNATRRGILVLLVGALAAPAISRETGPEPSSTCRWSSACEPWTSSTESPSAPSAEGIGRGFHVSVALAGSEFKGPNITRENDLGLLRGLGLTAALGYRSSPWRAEIEWFEHRASPLAGGSDLIVVKGAMLNGYAEWQAVPKGRWFPGLSVYGGLGFGRADVRAEIVTCRQPGGCPADFGAETGGAATATQTILGFSFGPPDDFQLILEYRMLKTGSLGLRDAQGRPFAIDRVDADLANFGLRIGF